MNKSKFLVGVAPPLADPLIDSALVELHAATGISGQIVVANRSVQEGLSNNTIVELRNGTGPSVRYVVECKKYIDRAVALANLKARIDTDSCLLVTTYLSPEMAKHCRSLNIQFIDTQGNAFLKAPGLYVFISGQRNNEATINAIRPASTNSPAALKTIFVLLSDPLLIKENLRTIARVASVSLAMASLALSDLVTRGMVINSSAREERSIREPIKLREEWMSGYAMRLRPKLQTRRFRAADSTWWEHAQFDGFHARWGGEVAAAHMTNYLKPATQTLYIDPAEMALATRELVRAYRLRPDPSGPVELTEAFWDINFLDKDSTLAPPLLVYTDLMATLDPRNIEVAKIIHDKWLSHA